MLYIGTAGYSYQDWVGPVYPSGTKKRQMLGYYAEKFNFTEVNSTYYSLPNTYMFYHMRDKTPQNFLFSVKAYKRMTHSRDAGKEEYRKFNEAVKPLVEAGKLACVLAQFPYSFHNNATNRAYLEKMRDQLSGLPVAVEFRNQNWITGETMNFLRKLDVAFVCVDMPRIRGLVKPVVAATASFGYIRFHGRNASQWYNHGEAYERYNYLYSPKELEEWLPRIKELNSRVEKVFISFNNHFQGKAVINGQMLKEMLEISK